VVDREGKAWKQRDHYTTPPSSVLPMGTNRPFDDRIADLVLDLDVSDHSTGDRGQPKAVADDTNLKDERGDKELVLDVDEVF
jgi:hypothetical protein